MVEITRTQIITVDTVSRNDYNDLLFTDKEGTQYKVSNKRVQYFEKIIQPNMAVQLHYATAYNKEYIYSVVQVGEKVQVDEDKLKPPGSGETPITQPRNTSSPEIGMCVKEIGELIRNDLLSTIYGKENAVNIVKWYRGYLASTLKFPCDGAKMPEYKVEP